MTYSVVDYADGRFAVLAVSASGSVYVRGPLLTLAEAEMCIEELRALMTLCGAPLARQCKAVLGIDHQRPTPAAARSVRSKPSPGRTLWPTPRSPCFGSRYHR